jgi:hypothetical protein
MKVVHAGSDKVHLGHALVPEQLLGGSPGQDLVLSRGFLDK